MLHGLFYYSISAVIKIHTLNWKEGFEFIKRLMASNYNSYKYTQKYIT